MAEEVLYGSVRPENGRKMLETERNITDMMDCISERMKVERRELTRQANKALYELAEKSGKSLWSLCYEVAPNWKVVKGDFEGPKDGKDVRLNVDWELELVPLCVDWQRDEGYWEKKYRELKERVKRLIDVEED